MPHLNASFLPQNAPNCIAFGGHWPTGEAETAFPRQHTVSMTNALRQWKYRYEGRRV